MIKTVTYISLDQFKLQMPRIQDIGIPSQKTLGLYRLYSAGEHPFSGEILVENDNALHLETWVRSCSMRGTNMRSATAAQLPSSPAPVMFAVSSDDRRVL